MAAKRGRTGSALIPLSPGPAPHQNSSSARVASKRRRRRCSQRPCEKQPQSDDDAAAPPEAHPEPDPHRGSSTLRRRIEFDQIAHANMTFLNEPPPAPALDASKDYLSVAVAIYQKAKQRDSITPARPHRSTTTPANDGNTVVASGAAHARSGRHEVIQAQHARGRLPGSLRGPKSAQPLQTESSFTSNKVPLQRRSADISVAAVPVSAAASSQPEDDVRWQPRVALRSTIDQPTRASLACSLIRVEDLLGTACGDDTQHDLVRDPGPEHGPGPGPGLGRRASSLEGTREAALRKVLMALGQDEGSKAEAWSPQRQCDAHARLSSDALRPFGTQPLAPAAPPPSRLGALFRCHSLPPGTASGLMTAPDRVQALAPRRATFSQLPCTDSCRQTAAQWSRDVGSWAAARSQAVDAHAGAFQWPRHDGSVPLACDAVARGRDYHWTAPQRAMDDASTASYMMPLCAAPHSSSEQASRREQAPTQRRLTDRWTAHAVGQRAPALGAWHVPPSQQGDAAGRGCAALRDSGASRLESRQLHAITGHLLQTQRVLAGPLAPAPAAAAASGKNAMAVPRQQLGADQRRLDATAELTPVTETLKAVSETIELVKAAMRERPHVAADLLAGAPGQASVRRCAGTPAQQLAASCHPGAKRVFEGPFAAAVCDGQARHASLMPAALHLSAPHLAACSLRQRCEGEAETVCPCDLNQRWLSCRASLREGPSTHAARCTHGETSAVAEGPHSQRTALAPVSDLSDAMAQHRCSLGRAAGALRESCEAVHESSSSAMHVSGHGNVGLCNPPFLHEPTRAAPKHTRTRTVEGCTRTELDAPFWQRPSSVLGSAQGRLSEERLGSLQRAERRSALS